MKKIITVAYIIMALMPKSNAQNTNPAGKSTCVCTFTPLILIPYASGTRVGWLNKFIAPVNLTSVPEYSVITNISPKYVNTGRIRNTASLGGLPVDFPGLSSTSLTGICIAGGWEHLLASGTMTVGSGTRHYILAADGGTSTDYIVSSVVVVNASFAPASTGWYLSHIEGTNGTTVYGIFTNYTSTYLASINLVTGVATALHYWPSTCFAALDVNPAVPGGSPFSKASLLDLSSSHIVEFNLSTSAISVIPLPVTLTGSTAGWAIYNYFLSTAYYDCYYPGLPTAIYKASTALPVGTTMYRISNMTPTVVGSNPIPGIFMSDIAPQH